MVGLLEMKTSAEGKPVSQLSRTETEAPNQRQSVNKSYQKYRLGAA